MPHQCVRCNHMYDDGAKEILLGCSCGSKLFFFIKKQHLDEGKIITSKLTPEDKEQIEKDVGQIINIKNDDDRPVVLDLESIRVMKPGQYELDLVKLFKNEPLIMKLAEGKYMLDISKMMRKKD